MNLWDAKIVLRRLSAVANRTVHLHHRLAKPPIGVIEIHQRLFPEKEPLR